MLISLSEALETTVSTLLGETEKEQEQDDLKAISDKLAIINLQLARRKNTRRKILRWFLVILLALIVIIFILLLFANSPYLYFNYSDPETAVVGVGLHAFEWTFVRTAPIVFIVAVVVLILTRK